MELDVHIERMRERGERIGQATTYLQEVFAKHREENRGFFDRELFTAEWRAFRALGAGAVELARVAPHVVIELLHNPRQE